jgi:membrane protease subunit HflC
MTDYSGLIEGVGSALVSILGLTKRFSFVKEGELGIKLRFGKARRDSNGEPKIIRPGFVMMIPWVDRLEKHHVRQQTIRFDSAS